jgi:thiol-disulfide isomerase/thioredoxin
MAWQKLADLRLTFFQTAHPDAARYRELLDEFERRAPQAAHMDYREENYLRMLELNGDKAAADAWRHKLVDSPFPDVVKLARSELSREYILSHPKPVDMKFTALDGSAFDMEKYRGKVVLIDFWATWCVPCVEELPNVKACYEKYHDKGFEVVGISLDREGDRGKLADFVKKHGIAWPQFFDGKEKDNVFALKYGIRGIPAVLLLDREGKIVETEARGPDLEPKVRKYLGL